MFGMSESGWRCWALKTVQLDDLKAAVLWPLQEKELQAWVLTWLSLVASQGSCLCSEVEMTSGSSYVAHRLM